MDRADARLGLASRLLRGVRRGKAWRRAAEPRGEDGALLSERVYLRESWETFGSKLLPRSPVYLRAQPETLVQFKSSFSVLQI